MKKAFLLLAVLFVTLTANAQFDICVGPKVGYQTTSLSMDKQTIKSDFKSNMTFGVFGRITFKKIIIQPELLYFKTGDIFEVSVLEDTPNWLPDVKPTFTINQSNLALPVFVGLQLLDLDLVKVRANVGPVFYFALGKTEYTANIMGTETTKKVESVSEDMTIGGALNFGVDVWRFALDVNYSLGLTDVYDDEIELGPYEFEVGDNSRQNIFTVTLGFKLL